jgi:hypothetical protein
VLRGNTAVNVEVQVLRRLGRLTDEQILCLPGNGQTDQSVQRPWGGSLPGVFVDFVGEEGTQRGWARGHAELGKLC